MPRKDRTFSDRDVLRIIARNLTRTEKFRVLDALGAIVDAPETLRAKEKAEEIHVKTSTIVSRTKEEISQIRTLLSGLELIPGPQRTVLTKINGILGLTEKGLDAILLIVD